jgi:hypothetical protein
MWYRQPMDMSRVKTLHTVRTTTSWRTRRGDRSRRRWWTPPRCREREGHFQWPDVNGIDVPVRTKLGQNPSPPARQNKPTYPRWSICGPNLSWQCIGADNKRIHACPPLGPLGTARQWRTRQLEPTCSPPSATQPCHLTTAYTLPLTIASIF